MTDLLIVGNGFDLYHGLPTRYTDFLKFISYWSIFWDNYNGEVKAQVCTPFRVKLSEQSSTTSRQSSLSVSFYRTILLISDYMTRLRQS